MLFAAKIEKTSSETISVEAAAGKLTQKNFIAKSCLQLRARNLHGNWINYREVKGKISKRKTSDLPQFQIILTYEQRKENKM